MMVNNSMEDDHTWRTLLGKLIADAHERQRIAHIVGVHPVTLTRWTLNSSNPRIDNLLPLLNALPQYHAQLIPLITKEYPHAFQRQHREEVQQANVPAPFYAQVLNVYTSHSSQRRATLISSLILQQLLKQLDPHKQGMIVLIAQCLQPRPQGYVRSLRQTMGKGTRPMDRSMEYITQFMGAESQTGHALVTGHPIVIQQRHEKERLFPLHTWTQEESSVAYPILLADQSVGCLYLASTQPNYFTQISLDLIQNYVELLVLAFEMSMFYDLHAIRLGVMPPRIHQLARIETFKARVTQQIVKASQHKQTLTRMQAETLIWQEIEEELLHTPIP